MTAFDRFDPFERRITEAIDEIAETRTPNYLDDILRQTARTSQRPRWTFPERWLPVDTALSRPAFGSRLPIRSLAILAVLASLLVASLAWYIGSRPHLPSPFGPAGNGQLITSEHDDLYIRDSLTGTARLFVGGDGRQFAPDFSPDGQYLTYVTNLPDGDHMFLANADGTNALEIAQIPATGNAQAQWAPDSRHVGLIYDVKLKATLMVIASDGSRNVLDVGKIVPLDIAWRPPNGDQLLIRARIAGGDQVALFTLKPDGTGLTKLDLPGLSAFGPTWTLSGSAWSPDGKMIAFNTIIDDAAANGGAYYRTSLANADGSNMRRLPPVQDDPQFDQAWPIFSPDGKWIVMESWYSQANGTAENQLAIVPADGSAPARNIGPRIPGHSLAKAWSPDGTRIVMSTSDSKTVYSIDPITGDFELMPYLADLPAWQRVAP